MKIQYGKLPTEQANPRTQKIDSLPVEKILGLMNREDAQVPRAVKKAIPSMAQAVKMIVASLKKGGRVFFAGAGTSGRLGVLEAAECPPTFNTRPGQIQALMAGGKSAVFRSKEGAEDHKTEAEKIFTSKVKPADIVIGIAASGVTPFVAGALEASKKKGAKTILVSCNGKPSFMHAVDCLVSVYAGPEVITGSTRLKAGTATKLMLNMLTVASMIQMGKVYQNWMVDLQPKSKKLVARGIRLIEHLGEVPPSKAEAYFYQAKKRVKVAILMAKKNLPYPEALKRLQKNSGFLKNALHP